MACYRERAQRSTLYVGRNRHLNLGITTCVTIEIFQDGPWTLAQKGGTDLGKIRGPRIWTSGRAIGGRRSATDAPSSRGPRGNITVTTADEARKAVQRKKERFSSARATC